MNYNIPCSLKEAVSSKSGKTYFYLSIQITPTIEKKVFLEEAELELLKIYVNSVSRGE